MDSVIKREEIFSFELTCIPENVDGLNQQIEALNQEIEKYTNHANMMDYGVAVASGLMTGLLDSLIVGQCNFNKGEIDIAHKDVNKFIERYAKKHIEGIDVTNKRLGYFVGHLEQEYKVAQDNVWKGAIEHVNAKNHHLADLAHHPTPLGMLSAIAVQYLRMGTFVSKDGKWHFKYVGFENEEDKDAYIIKLYAPIIIAVLGWIIDMAISHQELDSELPGYLGKIISAVSTVPLMLDIAKCLNNWAGHMVSDMAGSKNTAGKGMGIPGLFISFLYEVAAIPVPGHEKLLEYLNDLYVKRKINLRYEVPVYKALTKQSAPVILNEVIVSVFYFINRLNEELKGKNDFLEVNWDNVIPFNNRTFHRMTMVSSLTFTFTDSTLAGLNALIDSRGSFVLFASKFACRYNFVGGGRALVSVVKEVSNEQREAELIHERRMIVEKKTERIIEILDAYETQLNNQMSSYMAENLEMLMTGADEIECGLKSDNINQLINGTISIQKVFGKEIQFTNQEEFDDLMDSDIPLIF